MTSEIWPSQDYEGFDPDLREACRTLSAQMEERILANGWRLSEASGGVWVVAYGSPHQLPRGGALEARHLRVEDHGRLFYRSADEAYMYVTEPYARGTEALRELLDFCDEWELEVTIDAPSVWNPSGCFHIRILPAGVQFGGPRQT
jgi:hypothetical protein